MSSSLPALSNLQIEQGNHADPSFGGCFSRTNLPATLQAKYYIVNLDSAGGPGTHWCLLDNRRPNVCFYLDPFGFPPPEEVGVKMVKTNKSLGYNDVDVQDLGSASCGWWCEYFAEEFATGQSFRHAIAFATKQPNPEAYLESIYDKSSGKNGQPFRFHKENFLRKQLAVGGGLFEFIKKRLHFKPREHATKRFKSFVDEEGSKKIVKVEVGRKPIASGVSAALNVLSLGKLSKVKKELGYDNIYHNYMVVTLDDGRQFKIEKNHIVESSPYNRKKDKKDALYDVPVKGEVNLEQFIQKAEGKDKQFWGYDPNSRNCQKFVADMIHNNELTPEDPVTAKAIEPQDSEKLLGTLPSSLQSLPKKVTDLAGTLDRVVHGDGICASCHKKRRLKY